MAIKMDFAELAGDAKAMENEELVIERESPVSVDTAEPDKPASEKKELKPEDLTEEELRFLLEQSLLKKANEAAEKGEKIKPPSRAPAGLVWVFNRGPQKFEWQYDGIVYLIDGHEMLCLPERIARHGRKRSLISLDPLSNKAVFKLSIEGEEKFGVPLKVVQRTELMDRSTSANLLGDGRSTSAKLRAISVGGVAEMLARRQDTFAELE